jgi:hypothetical protein
MPRLSGGVGRFGGMECRGEAGSGPCGSVMALTKPQEPHPAAPWHSSPPKRPTRGLRTTPPDKRGIHNPPTLLRDQIYSLLKTSTQLNVPHYRWHGENHNHHLPSLDSPMGFPPHTKGHTATHTSHPHFTCRTQNYVYTVKYLKAEDQFNNNILYNNETSLLFQTMY